MTILLELLLSTITTNTTIIIVTIFIIIITLLLLLLLLLFLLLSSSSSILNFVSSDWVSFQTYPNLFGIKGFVVVVTVWICASEATSN
jgi:hypothetical protein